MQGERPAIPNAWETDLPYFVSIIKRGWDQMALKRPTFAGIRESLEQLRLV